MRAPSLLSSFRASSTRGAGLRRRPVRRPCQVPTGHLGEFGQGSSAAYHLCCGTARIGAASVRDTDERRCRLCRRSRAGSIRHRACRGRQGRRFPPESWPGAAVLGSTRAFSSTLLRIAARCQTASGPDYPRARTVCITVEGSSASPTIRSGAFSSSWAAIVAFIRFGAGLCYYLLGAAGTAVNQRQTGRAASGAARPSPGRRGQIRTRKPRLFRMGAARDLHCTRPGRRASFASLARGRPTCYRHRQSRYRAGRRRPADAAGCRHRPRRSVRLADRHVGCARPPRPSAHRWIRHQQVPRQSCAPLPRLEDARATHRASPRVIPFAGDIGVDAEDSIDRALLLSGGPPLGTDVLRAHVIAFPRLSNHTDVDALATEPGVFV